MFWPCTCRLTPVWKAVVQLAWWSRSLRPECLVRRAEADIYADKANRITVQHRHGEIVAVIEIISPGNKGSRAEFRATVKKAADLLYQGIHLLLVDLFPPSQREPRGIPQAVWDEFQEDDLELPSDKPLIVASYDAGPPRVAYLEPLAVGDVLPEMALFLKPEFYVPAPLEATYQTTWNVFPAAMKHFWNHRPGHLRTDLDSAAGAELQGDHSCQNDRFSLECACWD